MGIYKIESYQWKNSQIFSRNSLVSKNRNAIILYYTEDEDKAFRNFKQQRFKRIYRLFFEYLSKNFFENIFIFYFYSREFHP